MEANRVTLPTLDASENNVFDSGADPWRASPSLSSTELDIVFEKARPYKDYHELMNSLRSTGLLDCCDDCNNVRERFAAEPERLLGVVQVYGMLGCGSFSEVYHCSFQLPHGQVEQVAVKIFDQNAAHQDNEAALLKSLKHPNLISIVDVIHGVQNAIVLELCLGGSLEQLLHSSSNRELVSKLGLRTCVNAIKGVVSAVGYLHSYEIIHRDIKSGNCLLAQRMVTFELPTLKVGDLGFACKVSETGMVRWKGTVPYMAPEVYTSDTYGVSADIFSCGILFHELLSHKVPYSDCGIKDQHKLAMSISAGLLPGLDVYSKFASGPTIAKVLSRCWEAPASRISAAALIEDLELLLQLEVYGTYSRDANA